MTMIRTPLLVLAASLLGACGMTPVASHTAGYITTPEGNLLQDANGRCWRTVEWRPALAVAACDPEVVREQLAQIDKVKKKKGEPEVVHKPKDQEDPLDPFANATAGPVATEAEVEAAAAGAVAKQPRFRDEVVFEPITLNSDASFYFGQDQLTPEGRGAVVEIAGILKARRASDLKITVIGHTDRIGTAAANLALSRRRAAAVKAALVAEGIPAAAIETGGLGASKPLTQRADCPDSLVKCELISCLRPDRRVEIRTRGRVQNGTRQVPVEARHEFLQKAPADFAGAVCTAG